MSFRKEFTNYEISRLMYEVNRADGALYGDTIRDFIEDCTKWHLDLLDYKYKQVMEYYEDSDYEDAIDGILYEYIQTLYNECYEKLTHEPPQDIAKFVTRKCQIVPVIVERSELE